MKLLLTAIALLIFAAHIAAQEVSIRKKSLNDTIAPTFSKTIENIDAKSLKVLFIGNSYTHTNDLPGMLQKAATSMGLIFSSVSATPGGWHWMWHAVDSNTIAAIKKEQYDIVVLQEFSQALSLPDSTVEKESIPYLNQLVDTIAKYNPNAKLALYETWGRRDGDKQNGEFWEPVRTYMGMDSLIEKRYRTLSKQIGATMIPVGLVWRQIRATYPDIELYSPDGSHPSLLGTYASAMTFLSMFYQLDARQIAYYDKVNGELATKILDAVESVKSNEEQIRQLELPVVVEESELEMPVDEPFIEKEKVDNRRKRRRKL